ncbi:uncharacterized protein LOC110855062 isoform X1 [Folsomia candida]|uniref:Uncharacterized protein n=1 Tax=Folsomia candida TaxID=158441 RepID=A0A226DVK9_FOLCA|nr:uncharacterized protein LOC110855062 isoform X1 [Folsomia candida]OXA48844.1 hypothetical protein Fcan01_16743 [Folsomia candida]
MWRTVNCPQRVMIFLLSIFITGGLSVPINIVDNQTATLTMRPLREGSFRPSQGDIIVHRVSKSRQDGAIKPTKRAGRQFIIYGGCCQATLRGYGENGWEVNIFGLTSAGEKLMRSAYPEIEVRGEGVTMYLHVGEQYSPVSTLDAYRKSVSDSMRYVLKGKL